MTGNWGEMFQKIEKGMAELENGMKKEMDELKNGMAKKDEDIEGLKEQIGKLKKENRAVKRKMERIESYIPDAKKLLISRALPAELLNELFAALPFEIAFDLLAKMPNGLLARNVRKILKNIEMAMKANKWNAADCGPKLAISEGGLVVKHLGRNHAINSVRAQLPIPKFNSNANKSTIAYFELEILVAIQPVGIHIGFCTQQFPLEGNGNWVGYGQNSIGIWHKGGIKIDETVVNFENASGPFAIGEIIGIGILHFPANSTMKCFASCNGNLLEPTFGPFGPISKEGIAKLPIKFADLQFFPAVSMYFANDSIRANFGEGPFRYDPREIYQNL